MTIANIATIESHAAAAARAGAPAEDANPYPQTSALAARWNAAYEAEGFDIARAQYAAAIEESSCVR